jgi:hypothetical protein
MVSIFIVIICLIICLLILLFLVSINIENFNNNKRIEKYIEKNVTICFKTLYRKNLLYEHINDIRNILPNINIIVADDSDSNYILKNKNIINKFNNIEYLELPYDSGLSYGRNKAVEKVKTKYTIITDDSRCITDIKQIYELVNFMENNTKYDVICGNNPTNGEVGGKFTFLFDIINKKHIKNMIKQNKKIKIKINYKNIKKLEIINKKLELYKTHIGINCFLSKTSTLKKYKWDNNLKLREHKYFFLILFLNNINILYCDKFIFKQYVGKLRLYDEGGYDMRDRGFVNNVSFY